MNIELDKEHLLKVLNHQIDYWVNDLNTYNINHKRPWYYHLVEGYTEYDSTNRVLSKKIYNLKHYRKAIIEHIGNTITLHINEYHTIFEGYTQ